MIEHRTACGVVSVGAVMLSLAAMASAGERDASDERSATPAERRTSIERPSPPATAERDHRTAEEYAGAASPLRLQTDHALEQSSKALAESLKQNTTRE